MMTNHYATKIHYRTNHSARMTMLLLTLRKRERRKSAGAARWTLLDGSSAATGRHLGRSSTHTTIIGAEGNIRKDTLSRNRLDAAAATSDSRRRNLKINR